LLVRGTLFFAVHGLNLLFLWQKYDNLQKKSEISMKNTLFPIEKIQIIV